jgi:hypothetical protein
VECLVKKDRAERFDEVFQLMLIIETILIEFSFVEKANFFVVLLFVISVLLWAFGTLTGGTDEYPIKLLGFQSSLIVMFFVLLISSIGQIDLTVIIITAVVGIPSLAVIITLPFVYYLSDFLDRKKSFRLMALGTAALLFGIIVAIMFGIIVRILA